MQRFNWFITIALILLISGFIYFKDGAHPVSSQSVQSSSLRMDLANYINYSESNLSSAKLKGKSILFFAATTWCQSCSALETEIIEQSSIIPKGITILKVDYDNDKAMNQKYGITSQHTLVLLDENGQELKRWLGGGLDTLLQQLESI